MRLRKPDWYIIKRSVRFFFQRLFRGWDDSDTWSLDHSLAKVILPRFLRFRQCGHGFTPGGVSVKQWKTILDKIEYSFKKAIDEDTYWSMDVAESEKVAEGFRLFGKYYMALWW